ncbi:MAG: DUF4260 domain-containing protein [Halioglobus sp.]|nr:DUF4260 domain-containing protein [Halioglobus sp.]
MFLYPVAQRRIESAVVLFTSCYVYNALGFNWFMFAALFFIPDLSIFAYFFAGRRVGGIAYNLAHCYIGPITLALLGWTTGDQILQAIALIWLAHAAFDRTIGWGLKYPDSFCNTDMGEKHLPIANKYLNCKR